MARSLRIVLAAGWYHVTNRAHRRGMLFLDDEDRRRFLGDVALLPERFRVEVHAFVLMDNHYHLLLRLQEANLSRAFQWLQLSYGVRFNWAHRWVGHVFQGRFKAVLVEKQDDVAEVARYLHLNPVRIGGLELGKREHSQSRVTGCDDSGAELVRRRLAVLEELWIDNTRTAPRIHTPAHGSHASAADSLLGHYADN